ncbi:MAG: hypothetical protein NZ108_11185, partial [Bacteroidia bacterium]|nr:hypothetical protein [Bacteroidia bacterium]
TTATLKLARFNGVSWNIENIVSNTYSSHLDVAVSPAGDTIHLVYLKEDPTTFSVELKYARKIGGATWYQETIESMVGTRPGEYCKLALDASGIPHVAYFERSAGVLKYARRLGNLWLRETAAQIPDQIVGTWVSMQLTPDAKPYIAFRNETRNQILIASNLNGSWEVDTVIAGTNAIVGSPLVLRLDSVQHPWIAYVSQTGESTYQIAKRDSGSWYNVPIGMNPDNLANQLQFEILGSNLFILGQNTSRISGISFTYSINGAQFVISREKFEELSLFVKAYPNPFMQEITIQAEWKEPQTWRLEIFDWVGSLQFQREDTTKVTYINETISLSELPCGVYL